MTCGFSFANESTEVGSNTQVNSNINDNLHDNLNNNNLMNSIQYTQSNSSVGSSGNNGLGVSDSSSNNSFNNTPNTNSNSSSYYSSNSSVSSLSSTSASTESKSSVNSKPTTISQSSILKASNALYKFINKNGKLPNYITINGYKYSLSEYMYILGKTITYKYNKITSSIKAKYDVKNPSKPSGTNVKGTVSANKYYSYANYIVKYIEKYNRAPNYIKSGSVKIQYQTAIHSLNKVLNYVNSYGKLPSSLSINVKVSHRINKYLPVYNRDSSSSGSSSGSSGEAAGEPNTLSQSVIFGASKSVKNYVEKNKKLPNYVTISGIKFSMPEYMHLVSKAIYYKCVKSSKAINIKWNAKNPASPSGSTIKKIIPWKQYGSWAKKIAAYIEKYNTAPNYVNTKYGKVSYQTSIYGFSKVGAYISSYKKIPTTLSLSVSKTSSLNKYKPSYTRTSTNPTNPSYNLTASKNGIWVHSGDMKNLDLNLLGKYGIGNIFIHEDIFKNPTEAKNWIKDAAAKGFKIHIWFTTFYNATSKVWTNPIDTARGTLNQNYFDKVISRAKSYAAISGVAGIHLDYLRYPGSNTNKASIFRYDGGDGADAITEFVRQLSVAVKSVNSKLLLSAALMPEKGVSATYYGQDAPKLGKYLDILMPMVYKGNYNTNTAWIQSTIKWYVDNSGGAEVWGGLTGYYSDSDLRRLTVAELTADCKAVLAGGGHGIALFRWGTTNLFNLLGIK